MMESNFQVEIKRPKLSSSGQPSDGYWVNHKWLKDYEGGNSSMRNFWISWVDKKSLSLRGICLAQVLASQWRPACLPLGRSQGDCSTNPKVQGIE